MCNHNEDLQNLCFRSRIDGRCNNLEHPKLGAAEEPTSRVLPYRYSYNEEGEFL